MYPWKTLEGPIIEHIKVMQDLKICPFNISQELLLDQSSYLRSMSSGHGKSYKKSHALMASAGGNEFLQVTSMFSDWNPNQRMLNQEAPHSQQAGFFLLRINFILDSLFSCKLVATIDYVKVDHNLYSEFLKEMTFVDLKRLL